ncbi:hypothetical protein BEL04_12340 [Mucilaginibacter sp. PPCGB 2223]|uniref:DUF5008 domain-containing protein n=1 Tax=Mucilaginibacter sp. PPCGB 2223 TaxID=1886027 RepID=UPI0008255FFD|nr:DUF5008 domain-containing protein [Mucilaginibacter sp. PPCGB 2223]OCX52259.1 hypothetical protein BEL04_12340 [Mucilaginibacter sp. PPCGB 2223]
MNISKKKYRRSTQGRDRFYHVIILALTILLGMNSCKKNQAFDNPYAGGKPALGIQLSLLTAPNPQQGAPGTIVTFAATGLVAYKDQLSFLFNGTKAEVVSIDDASITVKVPVNSSTGITTLIIGDQVFFGPRFKVLGKISVDPAFAVLNGANGAVNNAYQMSDGRYLLVGAFTDYDTKGIISPIRRIVRSFKDGPCDLSFTSGGADGPLNSIVVTSTNMFVAGSFGSFFFNNGKSTLTNMSNITRLNVNGFADSIQVPVINSTKKKGVPAFFGGTSGSITKLLNFQNRLIAIGNFRYYLKRRYDQVYTNRIQVDTIPAFQVVGFNFDGSIDSTYRFDLSTHRGGLGGNGSVTDGVLQPDGKLILVGNFVKFDSIPAVRIVRLNTNGSIDQTFKSGAGTDRAINSISYSPVTNKFLITGAFTTYDGQDAKGIAMLNADGSLYTTFVSKGFTPQGLPTFARQLSNGLILVNGGFTTYNNVRRAGLMILTPTGDLATDYNSLGDFTGSIKDISESINSSGKLTVLLMGSFSQIDGVPVNNISRIVFEP